MLPQTVTCENCGQTAIVRAYGRIEFELVPVAYGATRLDVTAVCVTIDCPTCGVRGQCHRPTSSEDHQDLLLGQVGAAAE